MTREIATDHIRRYLLGELPPDDEAAIERAYFADPDFLARVDEVQHDLAHAYVTGRLTTAERTRFEQRLSTSQDQREELGLTYVLHEITSTPSTNDAWRPRLAIGIRAYATPLRWAAAGLFLVIVLFALWPSAPDRQEVVNSAPADSTPAVPTPPAATPNADNPAAREVRPRVPTEVRVATLLLTSDLTRAEGAPPTLTLANGVTDVTLVLPSEESTRDRSRARIESVEGRVMWTGLVDRGRSESSTDLRAVVHVSASVLARGDYILSIGDGEDSYYFRVR
jgi:hypothetical protein